MVEPEGLIHPQDDFRSAFPGLGFRDAYTLTTSGEQLLITDPTYLADVYNVTDDCTSFLRAHAVFLMDFGGDVRCPVWWQPPYVILPISTMPENGEVPEGIKVIADDVHTDSGSFIFLPLTQGLLPNLNNKINEVLGEGNGAAIDLPAGRWDFYYEQFPAPGENLLGLYRNIVIRYEGGDDGDRPHS